MRNVSAALESADKPHMRFWPFKSRPGATPGKTIVEYLPDADEIERSPTPKYAQITVQVLMVTIVTFMIWASVSQLDQVVVAQGKLVNPLPNVVVQPLETGIVQSVDVRSGQVVKKGERLATLDATFAQADEDQLKGRLASLETQIHGLEQELVGGLLTERHKPTADDKLQTDLVNERRMNYRAQQLKLAETAGKLRAALSTNRNDQQLIGSRLRSLREMEAMQEKMVVQKYAAPLQLLEAQQRTKEVERELELSASREYEIRRELAAFEAERTAFQSNWRQKAMEEMLTVTRERDQIAQQLQKASKRSALITLLSPVDGVVLEIAKLSPGSIVKEAETFFTLVPLNVALEAEVQVNSADVGYIKRGHPVQIKLDAFPFQRHGALDGKIGGISEDAFKRDASGKNGTDAYYLAKITLDTTTLRNMLDQSRLLPGMTLSAEIVVGKRTIMSYFAWPLTKGLDEAIREPR